MRALRPNVAVPLIVLTIVAGVSLAPAWSGDDPIPDLLARVDRGETVEVELRLGDVLGSGGEPVGSVDQLVSASVASGLRRLTREGDSVRFELATDERRISLEEGQLVLPRETFASLRVESDFGPKEPGRVAIFVHDPHGNVGQQRSVIAGVRALIAANPDREFVFLVEGAYDRKREIPLSPSRVRDAAPEVRASLVHDLVGNFLIDVPMAIRLLHAEPIPAYAIDDNDVIAKTPARPLAKIGKVRRGLTPDEYTELKRAGGAFFRAKTEPALERTLARFDEVVRGLERRNAPREIVEGVKVWAAEIDWFRSAFERDWTMAEEINGRTEDPNVVPIIFIGNFHTQSLVSLLRSDTRSIAFGSRFKEVADHEQRARYQNAVKENAEHRKLLTSWARALKVRVAPSASDLPSIQRGVAARAARLAKVSRSIGRSGDQSGLGSLVGDILAAIEASGRLGPDSGVDAESGSGSGNNSGSGSGGNGGSGNGGGSSVYGSGSSGATLFARVNLGGEGARVTAVGTAASWTNRAARLAAIGAVLASPSVAEGGLVADVWASGNGGFIFAIRNAGPGGDSIRLFDTSRAADLARIAGLRGVHGPAVLSGLGAAAGSKASIVAGGGSSGDSGDSYGVGAGAAYATGASHPAAVAGLTSSSVAAWLGRNAQPFVSGNSVSFVLAVDGAVPATSKVTREAPRSVHLVVAGEGFTHHYPMRAVDGDASVFAATLVRAGLTLPAVYYFRVATRGGVFVVQDPSAAARGSAGGHEGALIAAPGPSGAATVRGSSADAGGRSRPGAAIPSGGESSSGSGSGGATRGGAASSSSSPGAAAKAAGAPHPASVAGLTASSVGGWLAKNPQPFFGAETVSFVLSTAGTVPATGKVIKEAPRSVHLVVSGEGFAHHYPMKAVTDDASVFAVTLSRAELMKEKAVYHFRVATRDGVFEIQDAHAGAKGTVGDHEGSLIAEYDG